ncbi:MAG: transposase [Phycisphaerae bacterium]|jgi:REP element-mobilizing transposase RayT
MVGYMVTWTTYGTWLQGDRRGFVKDGKTFSGNENLEQANENLRKQDSVVLTFSDRSIILKAILAEAQKIGHNIEAIAVRSNHVHITARPCKETIEQIVSRYKNISRMALSRKERIWTRGFDKQFCFSEQEFRQRIKYVERHNK